MSPVDYEIQVNRKVKKTFHINMLKQWVDREIRVTLESSDKIEVSNLTCFNENEKHSLCNVVLAGEDEEKIEINTENPLLSPHENISYVKINSQIDANQKSDLNEILHAYTDVLTDVPGRTSAIKHDVILKTEVPVAKNRTCFHMLSVKKLRQKLTVYKRQI